MLIDVWICLKLRFCLISGKSRYQSFKLPKFNRQFLYVFICLPSAFAVCISQKRFSAACLLLRILSLESNLLHGDRLFGYIVEIVPDIDTQEDIIYAEKCLDNTKFTILINELERVHG